MPNEELPLPKSVTEKVKVMEQQIAALERAVKALLVAQQEVNDFSGRACMPEGTYYGVEF